MKSNIALYVGISGSSGAAAATGGGGGGGGGGVGLEETEDAVLPGKF